MSCAPMPTNTPESFPNAARGAAPTGAGAAPTVSVETVDLNREDLLTLVTGGVIRTRDKALKLSRRSTDPLPVHRCANGLRGSLFIVTSEYREWASRQELI